MTLVLDEHLIRFFNQTKDIYGDEIFLNYNDSSKDNSHSSFSSNITSFENQINKCHKCDLGYSRTNFVFGIGDPNASLMLVGEAPGEKEDFEGKPFVGRAGKLLDKILAAIDRSRKKDVFIWLSLTLVLQLTYVSTLYYTINHQLICHICFCFSGHGYPDSDCWSQ